MAKSEPTTAAVEEPVVYPPFPPAVQETLVSAPNREPRKPAATDSEAIINGLATTKTFTTIDELNGV